MPAGKFYRISLLAGSLLNITPLHLHAGHRNSIKFRALYYLAQK